MPLFLDKFTLEGKQILVRDSESRELIYLLQNMINILSTKQNKLESDFNSLAPVATSGSYVDLTDKPSLSPVATSGSYVDLTDKPSLSPVATSGSYADLTDKPNLSRVATSGSYADLTNKPSLSPVATSGSYADLTDKPNLSRVATSGSYNDLSNKPTIPDIDIISSGYWNRVSLDGKNYLINGSYSTTFNINQPYGSGYYARFSVQIPEAVRPPRGITSIVGTAIIAGAIVNVNFDNVSNTTINGFVSSPTIITAAYCQLCFNISGY